MKTKIQIVRLADGNEYYIPTDEKIKNFENIVQIVIQETMSKEEFDNNFDVYPNGMIVHK